MLTPPNRASLALRPLGYFLYGTLWLIMWLLMLAVCVFVVIAGAQLQNPTLPMPVGLLIGLFFIVVISYICVIAPWWILSQALLGFALAGQATSGAHDNERLARIVGYSRYRTIEARLESPATRLFTAMGNVGFFPGWRFFGSAVVLVAGVALIRVASSAPVALVGWLLLLLGLGLAALTVRARLLVELKRPWETDGPVVLTEKYYAGLAYRQKKRATDLQKARDAGRAPNATEGPVPTPFDRWAIAEVRNALREHPMTKYNARKGVPGALDPAIDTVFVAMDGRLPRERVIELVIEAAAYRGVKPVPVER